MYKYFIAFRYLRGRKITWLAVAGVTIGVMALLIVTSVMGGFQAELHERIRGTMGHISIESERFFGVHDPDKIEEVVEKMDSVVGTSPYIESIALFSGDTLDYGRIKGIDPVKESVVGKFNKYILTDEEAAAYGKIGRYEQKIAEYEARKQKYEPLIEELKSKGMTEKQLEKASEGAAKIQEKEIEKRSAASSMREVNEWLYKQVMDWASKLPVAFSEKDASKIFQYSVYSYRIEEYKGKVKELEKIKDQASERDPLKKSYVKKLFEGKQIRPWRFFLDTGMEISGRVLDENSSHVVISMPIQDRFSIENEITYEKLTIPKDRISERRLIAPIVVGVQWFKHYNVKIHNTVSIMTVNPDKLRETFSREFEVVGVFKTDMYENDFRSVYTDIKNMQAFMQINNRVSGISVRLKDHHQADSAKKLIEEKIRPFDDFGTLRVLTWEEKNKTLLAAVKVEKWLLSFILFFMIIIAGFMNLTILTMMVVEKTKDLGIIKAVGGTTGGVFSIFLFTGGFIGIIGTTIGCFLGTLFVMFINEIREFIRMLTGIDPFPSDVYYFDKIPAEFDIMQIAMIIVPAVLVSFLFSLYPAFRAAQLDPIEAFRHE